MKVLWQARASAIQQEREEVYVALQYAAGFHSLEEEWKDCEELELEPKVKWTFENEKGEAKQHLSEWCAAATKLSVYEMRKKQQLHENARKMCRTEMPDGRLKVQIGKMEKAAYGRT